MRTKEYWQNTYLVARSIFDTCAAFGFIGLVGSALAISVIGVTTPLALWMGISCGLLAGAIAAFPVTYLMACVGFLGWMLIKGIGSLFSGNGHNKLSTHMAQKVQAALTRVGGDESKVHVLTQRDLESQKQIAINEYYYQQTQPQQQPQRAQTQPASTAKPSSMYPTAEELRVLETWDAHGGYYPSQAPVSEQHQQTAYPEPSAPPAYDSGMYHRVN